uniref:Plantacyanin n=1 Tax=Anthurium amnicola TaxID=1678845 RepID=A0A1D1Z6Y7_9ARAE
MAMGQGRGSAGAVVLLGLVMLCFVVQSEAAVYVVGGNAGWTFNTVGWTRGKRFRPGDQLIFRYNPSVHNLVQVSGPAYGACQAPRGSKFYTSGNDRITLGRGTSYFICSFVGHCQSAMKIAVTAA